jgi:hypothetical protein
VAQYVHATVRVLMVAVILGHIYIGTLGMEGAYDAMGSGEVDLAWARAHHSVWVEKQQAKTASGAQLPRGGIGYAGRVVPGAGAPGLSVRAAYDGLDDWSNRPPSARYSTK